MDLRQQESQDVHHGIGRHDTGAEEAADAGFIRLTHSFRGELLAHSRRMLGSVGDAEDAVQETYLRAWRSYTGFQGRSSLRTWLYRIATNVCLTILESRGRLPLPAGLPDADWVTPGDGEDPATIVTSRENRRRALLVAWRHLSARQRAVLILHDVLAWQAIEIADLLETSGTAVHSMIRRARATLARLPDTESAEAEFAGPSTAQEGTAAPRFLSEYAAAFETGDISPLVRLLTEDTVCERRPFASKLVGRDTIVRFLEHCPAVGHCRMVPITLNGRPGFGVYREDADGVYRAYTIDVLTITDTGFEHIEVLEDRTLFATFGLPPVHRPDPS